MNGEINRFESTRASNSITNAESLGYDDSDAPYTLLEWIERTGKQPGNADSHVSEYNTYLKQWRNSIDQSKSQDILTVQDVYIRFLSDIISTYSSTEEKRYIQNINLRNPAEADAAMSVYTKRLREIIQLVYDQRHTARFQKIKHSLRGSRKGLEKLISDSIDQYDTSQIIS
jgi:hypothetical protein